MSYRPPQEEAPTATVEAYVKFQKAFINRAILWSTFSLLFFLGLLTQYFLTDDPSLLIAAALLGPFALPFSFAAYSLFEAFKEVKGKLEAEVLIGRVNLAFTAQQESPPGATHLLLQGEEGDLVTVYRPLQWWGEDGALLPTGSSLRDMKVYRDVVKHWEEGSFEGAPLISLQKLHEDLTRLSEKARGA